MVSSFQGLVSVLRASGLQVRVNPSGTCITVRGGDAAGRFVSLRRLRSPYPAELKELDSKRKELSSQGIPLLLVPYVSQGLGDRLTAAGWSWADDSGNWDLRGPGLLLQRRVSASPPKTAPRDLPTGAGSRSVMRWLIHLAPETTTAAELARRIGVSRPRVSQVLAELVQLGLVEHPSRTAWRARGEELLDRFVVEYREPGGIRSHHYTLQAPNEAAAAVAKSRKKQDRIWIGGDVAADLLVPHRRPTHLRVYCLDGNPRLPTDWVEAAGAEDANIEVIASTDLSIATSPLQRVFRGTTVPVVDPTQVLWDLHDSGGDDRLEAAEKVRAWILSSRSTS